MTHLFRAIWPIVDDDITLRDLISQATRDLPAVAARAHADLSDRGRWYVADSTKVPGSGRITPTVLVYEAPATEKRRTVGGTGRRGVGIGERSQADVLEDVAWLRENGYRRASNRQLADRLGMSLKALEKHLMRGRHGRAA